LEIAKIFKALKDPISRDVSLALTTSHVDLHVFSRERFETMLEGIPAAYWPSQERSQTFDGIYLRAGARNPLKIGHHRLILGAIYVAVPAAHLCRWAEPEEVLFEGLSTVVHEFQHDRDRSQHLDRRCLEERATRLESCWRSQHTRG